MSGRRTIRHLVEAAGYASYDAYMESPHWRRVRRAWRARRDVAQWCVACGADDFVLHHRWYERPDGSPVLGQERVGDLVPLCRSCHAGLHASRNRQRPLPSLAAWTEAYVDAERRRRVRRRWRVGARSAATRRVR